MECKHRQLACKDCGTTNGRTLSSNLWPRSTLLVLLDALESLFKLGDEWSFARSETALLNVTIPAILLIAAEILLIAGLWTPVAGILVALTEIWKMLMLPGDKWLWLMMGTAGAALAVRTGPMVDRRSPLWLEAPRSYTPKDEL